jgi:hypothetical protein
MSRILAGVLASCLVLAIASVAGAGIPDPTLSTIALDTQAAVAGLMTCPAGDANAYEFLKVTAKRADSTPIQGIPYSSFFFTVTGGSCTITAQSAETDVNGEILFDVVADEAIAHPNGNPVTGSPIDIDVQIYTVALDAGVSLTCNTVDYNLSGDVNPVDFGFFAADFGSDQQRSDFNWGGGTPAVNPVDFGFFAAHFGH